MNKKFLMGLGATLAVVASVAAMSAYEAHVINVTAHIENALSVAPKEIEFGTVFPQEYVEEQFTIALSDSFMTETRVDDVEYIINQKTKCWDWDGTGEKPTTINYAPVNYWDDKCPSGFHPMLSLCSFLSKTDADPEDNNDSDEPSYYDPKTNSCPERDTGTAFGRLTKIGNDISDTWIVDLKVPPVEGTIGQDWPVSCAEWTVPVDSRDYGCDLWIEVTHISLSTGDPVCGNGIKEGTEECDDGNLVNGDGCSDQCIGEGICSAKPDVMLVLDRSGSIDSTELITLKTASHAFVTALDPKTDGAHMGQSSFATVGSLDLHLTGVKTDIDNAIDALINGGYTNLYEGIDYAYDELNDGTHDRLPDADSPDYMVIITDGEPNEPGDDANARAVAKGAADTADGNGIIIYVVGVGVNTSNADWLKANIATTPSHYYDAGNFSALQLILEGLASCN